MAMQRYSPNYLPQGPAPRLTNAATANPLEDTLTRLEKLGGIAGVAVARDRAQADVLSGGNPSDKLPLSPAALAYNEAAHDAYSVRTESQIRGKVQELSARFDGRNPTDPQSFAEMFDASADEIVGAVPDHMRERVQFEVQTRRTAAIAGITETAQRFQFQRDTSEMQAGITADIEEASVLARDGADPAAIGAIFTRANQRIDKMVALGVWNPGEAEMQRAEVRSQVHAESIFGEAMRDGNLVEVYQGVQTGKIGGPSKEGAGDGLTIDQRDRLAAKLYTEANRRHADAERAETLAKKDMKVVRDAVSTQLWASVYGADQSKRPSSDHVVSLQKAGLIDAEDAQQVLRTLASPMPLQTDPGVLDALDRGIHDGEDMRPAIDDAVRNGVLAPADAVTLRGRNQARGEKLLPDPIDENRKTVLETYTESGPMAAIFPGQETARRRAALEIFDQAVRDAPAGVNPATGMSFREEAAEAAKQMLKNRNLQIRGKAYRDIPPTGAVFVPDPLVGQLLNVDGTKAALRQLREAGQLDDKALAYELRLIKRWQDADLVVK